MNATLTTSSLNSFPSIVRPARVSPAYLGLVALKNKWPRRPQRPHRPPASYLLELTREHARRHANDHFNGLVQTLIFGVSAAALGYFLHALVQFVSSTGPF